MRRRGTRPWSRLFVSCLVLASIALAAQDPASDDQPTFRTGTTYVEVDVTVTDGSGFVRDLTRDDFTVFEDGVPQDVASFAVVDLPAPQEWRWRAASRADLVGTASADALVPEARVYAVLLDMAGWIHNPSTPCERQRDHVRRVRRLAAQFLETSLGPDDVMSVYIVHLGLVQELTKSRPLLRSAIAAFDVPQPRVARPSMGTCHNSPLSPGSGLSIPSQLGRPSRGIYSTLTRIAGDLAPVTGRRKAIVWIGGEVAFHDVGPDYREAIRAATRHNVVIHPVEPNGLSAGLNGRPITGEGERGFLDRPSNGSELMRLGALRGVAEDTGGVAVVNTNNFSGGFERIVHHNSTYYLLGYQPAVDHRDGRFHSITVRVNRPGVSVRARRGYFASEPVPVLPPPAPVIRSAAEIAVASLGTTDRRAPLHVHPSWVPGAVDGTGLIWVRGEIDAQAQRDPEWAGGASIEILVRGDDEGTAAVHEVAIPAGESAFEIRLPEDGAFAPGEYTLQVRLTTAGSVIPWTLTTTVRGEEALRLGEGVLWRRGTSTGPRHVRTASAQFRRTEQLRMEWPTRADVPASARLLDRTGAPMRVPLSIAERRDDRLTWLVVDVPVGALAAGEYVVELAQGEALRLTPFRVVP